MSESVVIQDVFACAVPDELIDAPRQALYQALTKFASLYVLRQYLHTIGPGPQITFQVFDWLITTDPAQVEAFQPAHDCPACRAGNDQALAHLREHPHRPVALANITYTERWPE